MPGMKREEFANALRKAGEKDPEHVTSVVNKLGLHGFNVGNALDTIRKEIDTYEELLSKSEPDRKLREGQESTPEEWTTLYANYVEKLKRIRDSLKKIK